jgi:hypothetical protein
MEAMIYNFDTRFNFGKFKGKTLYDVLYVEHGAHYVGYLIVLNVMRFILDQKVLMH